MARTKRTRIAVADLAEVVCDETGRVGPLSYRVPPGLTLAVGDAVKVPFGAKERYGVVVGPGDGAKATKDVMEVFGPRSDQVEITLAAAVAAEHALPFAAVAPRLGPRTRRGNPALHTGPVALVAAPDNEPPYPTVDPSVRRRLLAPAPSVDVHRLAAVEAARIAADGQVLVLCPTKHQVEAVLAEFASGAARLDMVPAADQPSPWRGFVEGTVAVAVATRTAALWAAADLAGIVVVDEDHPGHDEPAQPYTNARTLAIRRTAQHDAELVLVGQNPSLTALSGNVRLIQVGTRADWPKASYVATGDLPPEERILPNVVLAAIADRRRAGKPAFVVAPQASSTVRCVKCKLPGDPAQPCSRCTGKVRGSLLAKEHLSEVCTKATVLTIHELITAKPRPGALVVVLAADLLDATADIAPSRQLAQVCAAATRLAGATGEVIVTTRQELPPTVVDLVLRPDHRRHARRIWAAAKAEGLPPFAQLIEVRHQRATPPRVPTFPEPIRVLGPKRIGEREFSTVLVVPHQQRKIVDPWLLQVRKTGRVQIKIT